MTGTEADPTSSGIKRKAQEDLAPLVDGERPGELVEAFIELGATVCTPQAPFCEACPLAGWCTARREDRTREIPSTPDGGQTPTRAVVALFHRDEAGVLLRKRPTDGLLGGLWGLPMAEKRPGESPEVAAARALGGSPCSLGEEPLVRIEHVFSHKRWDVHVYEVDEIERALTGGAFERWKRRELDVPPCSALDEKIHRALSQTTLQLFS